MSDTGFGAPHRSPSTPLGRHALCRWHECCGCEHGRVFVAHDDAIRWLQTVATDPGATLDIRCALASCGDDLALWRADDQRAIVQLAAMLVTGQMRVCGDKPNATLQRREEQRQRTVSAGATTNAVPIGVAIARSTESPPPPKPVEEEPAVELDVAAMVETLRAAARDGVPFCEECARTRRRDA